MSAPVLRDAAGRCVNGSGSRWLAEADAVEVNLLERLPGPVLDVGCGPGRHVVALSERGIPALGIDVTPVALDLARGRGAPVLERSVFDRVPGAGRWGSALLLDGNVGIGGAPAALLRRVGELLRPGGQLLVECLPPGTEPETRTVRFEAAGDAGPWFDWVDVGADHLDRLAGDAGLDTLEVWPTHGRWFGFLQARGTARVREV